MAETRTYEDPNRKSHDQTRLVLWGLLLGGAGGAAFLLISWLTDLDIWAIAGVVLAATTGVSAAWGVPSELRKGPKEH